MDETAAGLRADADELDHCRFWASIHSELPQRREQARSSLDPKVALLDVHSLAHFAESLQAAASVTRDDLMVGTRMLLAWPRSVEELSPMGRFLADRAFCRTQKLVAR
jgi:hypothetical protein